MSDNNVVHSGPEFISQSHTNIKSYKHLANEAEYFDKLSLNLVNILKDTDFLNKSDFVNNCA